MITIRELLSGQSTIEDLPEEIQSNIFELHNRINKIRSLYGKPLIVTSGYRSMAHHIEIYRRKNITKIPLNSNHLIGCAVDISDVRRELQNWCKNNISEIERIGLWIEDFKYTCTWCHFQIVPPKSGNRFFIP